ncbi:mannosyltransferase [Polyrhizophydium stewartii]|uniref:Mannosyltransferase n=1 Tax=Polyrhizophydium stewartii TaxID=2732419 RepID=A0ABR4N157_9FUNG
MPHIWRALPAQHTQWAVVAAGTKHFQEVEGAVHLDARFGAARNGSAAAGGMRRDLRRVFRAWAAWADDNSIPYWLAHGTLLGWWWGGEIMPWDDDLDVQVNANTLFELARHNGTLIGGRFLLDVNPRFIHRTADPYNVIDFRVIDTKTGFFIDGTGLSRTSSTKGRRGVRCKSPHEYVFEDLFPLVRTEFEGIPTWRPARPRAVLDSEYPIATAVSVFRGHEFNMTDYKWHKIDSCDRLRNVYIDNPDLAAVKPYPGYIPQPASPLPNIMPTLGGAISRLVHRSATPPQQPQQPITYTRSSVQYYDAADMERTQCIVIEIASNGERFTYTANWPTPLPTPDSPLGKQAGAAL